VKISLFDPLFVPQADLKQAVVEKFTPQDSVLIPASQLLDKGAVSDSYVEQAVAAWADDSAAENDELLATGTP